MSSLQSVAKPLNLAAHMGCDEYRVPKWGIRISLTCSRITVNSSQTISSKRETIVVYWLYDEEVQQAASEWGYNCGPGALCGLLGLKPSQVRPHLGDFEAKGFLNPTMMRDVLDSLGYCYNWKRIIYRDVHTGKKTLRGNTSIVRWPDRGLVRVQWDGPWCDPDAYVAAPYSRTHWVACRGQNGHPHQIFDVNPHTWTSYAEWVEVVVPLMLDEVKGSTGAWWPTHCVDLM